MHRSGLAAAALLQLCACIAPGDRAVRYLDETSAATVTTVARPLVLARERRDLASHARDYATLAALAVNRGGRLEYFLVLYPWSTLDPRLAPAPPPAGTPLLIATNQRVLRFAPDSRTLREAGTARTPHAPAGGTGVTLVFAADRDKLNLLGDAQEIALLPADKAGRYELWSDGREALRDFLAALPQR